MPTEVEVYEQEVVTVARSEREGDEVLQDDPLTIPKKLYEDPVESVNEPEKTLPAKVGTDKETSVVVEIPHTTEPDDSADVMNAELTALQTKLAEVCFYQSTSLIKSDCI